LETFHWAEESTLHNEGLSRHAASVDGLNAIESGCNIKWK